MNSIKSPEKESGCGPTTIILALVLLGLIFYGLQYKSSDSSTTTYTPSKSDKKIFTFTLTHALGKKLPKDATFTCGDTPIWTLNMNNGSELKYTIISADPDGSLCGIKAMDNLGDNCELCIISEGEGKMTLRLRYSDSITMVYKGYAN